MPKNISTNFLAFVAVAAMILLIGMVALLATSLVNRTVLDQFRSQELQLVSSLSQQTETYFLGLNADVNSLSLEPDIKTVLAPTHDAALARMDEYAQRHTGVIRSMLRFDYRGNARYAWPSSLHEQIMAGERPPYSLPSSLLTTSQAENADLPGVTLVLASRRDDPNGTFLLIAPLVTDLRKVEFVVYELNLDELFSQSMGFIDLKSDGQIWVIDSINAVLYQANKGISIDTLYDHISLASLTSFRQAAVEDYDAGGTERLAAIAPIHAQGRTFVVVLSRTVKTAQDQVRSDLRLIFGMAAGAVLLLSGMAWLALRRISKEAKRRQEESQRRQTARALLEVSRALNSTLDLESVLRSIMAELYNLVPYDSAAILLLDRSKLAMVAHRGADLDQHTASEFDLEEAQAANQVIQTGKPLVIQDTATDERWATAPNSQIRAWMGLPLRVREKTVGVLNINSHTPGSFSVEEIELAEAFADQASIALQNARLHDVEVKQIEQELSIARDIQLSLLPSAAPDIAQLDIAAITVPARQVSGDYFQYLPMPNGRLGIAVGDVSGKGIPAAILMAVITTALRDELARNARPADLLNALNQRLLERMKETHVNSALMVGIFDPPTRHIELANGGMVQPYVRSGKEWTYIPVGGYPLGVSNRMAYDSKTVTLAPGAVLLIASDGVVEAQNASGEFFGFERLEALLNDLPLEVTAQQVIDRIIAAVHDYVGDGEPADDLTIVAVRSLEVMPVGEAS